MARLIHDGDAFSYLPRIHRAPLPVTNGNRKRWRFASLDEFPEEPRVVQLFADKPLIARAIHGWESKLVMNLPAVASFTPKKLGVLNPRSRKTLMPHVLKIPAKQCMYMCPCA